MKTIANCGGNQPPPLFGYGGREHRRRRVRRRRFCEPAIQQDKPVRPARDQAGDEYVVRFAQTDRCGRDANGAPHYPDAGLYAKKFSDKHAHRDITGGIGHNLPQEAPQAFAQAIIDVDGF